MKIFVCIKQVADTETKVKILADKTGLDPAGVKWVMNPYDEYAVEEALRFREANAGAQVCVLSAGPKTRIVDTLRTALAMGADEAIAINTPENLANTPTAKALAKVIQTEGNAHLIFTGKIAIDDNSGAVSQMIAEFLGMPHVTVVSKFSMAGDKALVERDIEGGAKEVIELQAPAVLAATKGLNVPRYASLPGIMKAKKKTIKEVEFASLDISPETTKVKWSEFALPPEKPSVKMLAGEAGAQVHELVQLLRDEAKVL